MESRAPSSAGIVERRAAVGVFLRTDNVVVLMTGFFVQYSILLDSALSTGTDRARGAGLAVIDCVPTRSYLRGLVPASLVRKVLQRCSNDMRDTQLADVDVCRVGHLRRRIPKYPSKEQSGKQY
ncbi:hypothetical protein E4U53_002947 [Claviceps sorghi]|nr:hypothetical protein E4U53_002947 [Claviceps sorghi]